MRAIFKRSFCAAVVLIAACGPVIADMRDDFRSFVSAGDAAAVQTLIETLDAANVAAGFSKNSDLRWVFDQFSTTRPQITELLVNWKQVMPDSPYRKVAEGWYLDHLAWLARGSKVSVHTHPNAFKDMYLFQERSADLGWEVFNLRNDFVPASDLVSISYLTNFGVLELDDFAQLALAANPDPDLLDRIVYAVSPKWGGSWEEIVYLCDTYADKMSAPDWYGADVCKATAVFNMPSIHTGGQLDKLEWARSVMAATPDAALRGARFTDMFYLRPKTLTPETADLAVSLYDPAGLNALRFAMLIEDMGKVKGFYAEQEPKVAAAEKARVQNDPLNPSYIWEKQVEIYSKYPGAVSTGKYGVSIRVLVSSKAMQEFMQYLEEMAGLFPSRPEVWASIGLAKQMVPGGSVFAKPGLADLEKAILLSNYDFKYVAMYFEGLALAEKNLRADVKQKISATDITVSHEDEPLKVITYDPAKTLKGLECPIVRAARLVSFMCTKGSVFTQDCQRSGLRSQPAELVAAAHDLGYCPELLDAPVEALLLDEPRELWRD